MEEYKKKIIEMSDSEIIHEHKKILSELYEDEWTNVDAEQYEIYWREKRPMLEKKIKVVENELSYRSITI